MTQEIQAIRFDAEDVGKHLKSSKKRYTWNFNLNGTNHTVVLDSSFISEKVKVVVDLKTILESQLPKGSSFQHPFNIDGFALNVLQQGQSFQLRINNKAFSHLYNQSKTKTQFKNYQDQVKDINVDQASFQNQGKTVKLNIGALDGAVKKNNKAVQSQNWNEMGASQSGIPSYFGENKQVGQQPVKKQQNKANLLDTSGQSSPQKSSSQQNKSAQIQPKPQQQFNTMQNMFATMNVQNQPVNKNPPQTSLDLLEGSLKQPTPQQFNTMQNMFATKAQNPTLGNINQITMNPIQQPITQQVGQFNTMQNLFATGLPGQNVGVSPVSLGQPNVSLNNQMNFPSPSQFNTMQNLFSTQNPGATGYVAATLPSNPQNIPNFPNPDQFNTMQNMFKTMNTQIPANLASIPTPSQFATGNAGISISQLQSIGNKNTTGANDFNTMQNLFATSSNANSTATMNTSGVNATLGQQPINYENINLQDFNTMQNLFKTGAVNLPSPTQLKKQDQSASLGLQTPITTTQKSQTTSAQINAHQVTFNTYSGAKSNTSPVIDASTFGTMQKGHIGNIDFLGATTQQPQQVQQPSAQVPNFSKKKQPLEQDSV